MDNIIMAKELLHLAKEIVGVISPNDMKSLQEQAEKLDNRKLENRDYSVKEIIEMFEKETAQGKNPEASDIENFRNIIFQGYKIYRNTGKFYGFPMSFKNKFIEDIIDFIESNNLTVLDDKTKSFSSDFSTGEIKLKKSESILFNGLLGIRLKKIEAKNFYYEGFSSLDGIPEECVHSVLIIDNCNFDSFAELKDKKISSLSILDTEIKSLDGMPEGIKLLAFENCTGFENIKGLPKSIETIGFYSNPSLTSIEGIENFFTNLKSITILENENLKTEEIKVGSSKLLIPLGLPHVNVMHQKIAFCDDIFKDGFNNFGYI